MRLVLKYRQLFILLTTSYLSLFLYNKSMGPDMLLKKQSYKHHGSKTVLVFYSRFRRITISFPLILNLITYITQLMILLFAILVNIIVLVLYVIILLLNGMQYASAFLLFNRSNSPRKPTQFCLFQLPIFGYKSNFFFFVYY